MYYLVSQDFIKEKITPEMMEPHVAFVRNLIEKGISVVSGPFADERKGGMFILDVETESQALELAKNDPAVISGILINDIRPFLLLHIKEK